MFRRLGRHSNNDLAAISCGKGIDNCEGRKTGRIKLYQTKKLMQGSSDIFIRGG